MKDGETIFSEQRGRLTGLAYRMLGSMNDAEDVVQDAWLKFSARDQQEIRSPEAYLVTMTTRLCLDRLKSARARREVYVGPWLPEPVPDADALSPQTALELADDISFALMLTLERLSAPERAAFLLHDVFDQSFAEVAQSLEKSEAACRQLAARARKAVRASRPANRATNRVATGDHQALLTKFLAATASGDVNALTALLAKDAVSITDGGGLKTAALRPIIGADKVARFFVGLRTKAARLDAEVDVKPVTINGGPALLMYLDGVLDQTVSLDTDEGEITAIYVVRNPEKLTAMAAIH